jgi:hypothetical protein
VFGQVVDDQVDERNLVLAVAVHEVVHEAGRSDLQSTVGSAS